MKDIFITIANPFINNDLHRVCLIYFRIFKIFPLTINTFFCLQIIEILV